MAPNLKSRDCRYVKLSQGCFRLQRLDDTAMITRGHSCVLCQQRKVKCDRQKPCSNCTKARAECVVATPSQPRRRRRNVTESDLLIRLKRYERLLKSHGVTVDVEDPNPLHFRPPSPGDDDIGVNDVRRLTMNAPHNGCDAPGALFFGKSHAQYIENTLWDNLKEEMLDPQPDSSSEDEAPESLVLPPGENVLMGFGSTIDLIALHPSVVHIFRLWQVFLDNVNPLVKMFHAPTMQQIIIDASGDMSSLSRPNEALLFSIYFLAVVSLTDQECETHFSESRQKLLAKYTRGVQQALVNAKVLRSLNLTTLQAFVLYLTGGRRLYDPHTVWTLTGVAVRIAQRLGIHTDMGSSKFPPFDAEMRRRTWWQIVFLDGHASKLAGAPFPAWLAKFDSKTPLNISDSELNPTMKELPQSKEGVTEMVFCSMRYETVNILRKAGTFQKPQEDGTWTTPTIPELILLKEKAIAELGKVFDQKYIQYCDPSIPLQMLMIYMAKSVLLTMKIMAHHPRQYPDRGASMPQEEKDMLFDMCLTELEIDSMGHRNELMIRFMWHVHVYFQVDAFIYVLSELRIRSSGPNVERAWEQITLGYEHRPELADDVKNSLYYAIGSLAIKAWAHREDAVGNSLETPSFISKLRTQRKLPPQREAVPQAQKLPPPPQPITFNSTFESEAPQPPNPTPSENHLWNTEYPSSSIEMTFDVMPGVTATDWDYWQSLMDGELPSFDVKNGDEEWM